MIASINSGALFGIEGTLVKVEVDITKKGFGSFRIVGLPNKAVDESKDRVQTAIGNSGYDFPKYKLTVNLAPASISKEGPMFDLPIAVATLIAAEQITIHDSHELSDCIFFGELSLDGSLNTTTSILPLSVLAVENEVRNIYVPAINALEAAIVPNANIYPVESLKSLADHLSGVTSIQPLSKTAVSKRTQKTSAAFSIDDVKGQAFAKRALVIAASGGHNILLNGSPGAGKTMLAKALPSLLPELSNTEALDVTKIHSVAGLVDHSAPLVTIPPFRTPHHSASRTGVIGGGSNLQPGEISLAHRGVLFLDEIPEFPRSILESLRQPLEDGTVTISRAKGTARFPAQFMLVASSNPCPCGWHSSSKNTCTCSPISVSKYQKKLSGPLLDRIDIHTNVESVEISRLLSNEKIEKQSTKIKERILAARKAQHKRFNGSDISLNAHIPPQKFEKYCYLDSETKSTLSTAAERMRLSARSVHKIIKVARTIADLEEQKDITVKHIYEALNYRKQ